MSPKSWDKNIQLSFITAKTRKGSTSSKRETNNTVSYMCRLDLVLIYISHTFLRITVLKQGWIIPTSPWI